MFDIEGVPVTLRKLALKIADTEADDGDPQRVRLCEITFRVPVLGHDLASKIRLPIVGHCFGKDRLPLWGVNEVRFEPLDEQYTATLASAPDAPSTADLALAEIVSARVWRPNKEKRDLALEFVTRHELARGDARDLAALLSAWEASDTYLTLITTQIPLELEPADAEPVDLERNEVLLEIIPERQAPAPRRRASTSGSAH